MKKITDFFYSYDNKGCVRKQYENERYHQVYTKQVAERQGRIRHKKFPEEVMQTAVNYDKCVLLLGHQRQDMVEE